MSSHDRPILSEPARAIVCEILARHVSGRPVFVFGSRATGRAAALSDLDLAIGGPAPLDLSLKADLAQAFDESDLPISVDVVDLATVSETFRKRIMAEWVPFDLTASHNQDPEVAQ